MLRIEVPGEEFYDEVNEEFVYTKPATLQLEHSLVSLSKWESKWHKAFLGKQDKTDEELEDYIRCMTITQNVDPNVYKRLTPENYDRINSYIEDPMTASSFYGHETKKTGSEETVTAELIYYWMISFNIPVEFQKWHLNRLLTLIRVCSVKNTPPKKHSKQEIMSRNAMLNAQRRKKLGTKG